jgi:hypothetical protein
MERFKNIFEGLHRAYGTFKEEDQDENGKKKGKAYIIKAPITDELWEGHISGKASLGIIPIRDDSKCRWGCIDVDSYTLDHKQIVDKLNEYKIPLICCRSKSGGAHLFLFLKDFVEAKKLRNKLVELAGELGYADCEVFPKQIEIRADRGDTGNFLNLPYFSGDDSFRYAYDDTGASCTLDQFYGLVDKKSVEPKDLSKIKVTRNNQKKLEEGPPCLETLMNMGIPEGGRDNALYQYAVYAKKAFPDAWKDKVNEFNSKHMDRPLGFAQVEKTIKQHEKTDYQYKCKDQPMCAVCNAPLCKARKFGIGDNYDVVISDLTKLESDESMWFLNVDGKRMSLSTEQLFDQQKFRRACMDYLTILPMAMKANDWTVKVRTLLENAEIIPAKDHFDTTTFGKFDEHFGNFIFEQGAGLEMDEVITGKCFTEENKTYFKMVHLEDYLKKKRFTEMKTMQIVQRLRDMEGGSTSRKILGKTERLWFVPQIQREEKSLKRPEIKDAAPF